MATLASQLVRFASDSPDTICLWLLSQTAPPQAVRYVDLYREAQRWAKALQSSGVQEGDVVIIIQQHDPRLIYAFWGAALLGAIPSILPFPTEKLDPDSYRRSLHALIEVTGPAAIVTYPEFEPELRVFLDPPSPLKAILTQPADALIESVEKAPGVGRAEDDLALLQHSSGTTGLQKGVALTHWAIFQQIDAYSEAIRLRTDDVVVSWLPLYHDMGLIPGFLMPILSKNPLVLMSPFDWVRAPAKLLRALHEYQGTLAWLPNFAFNFCAGKIREGDLDGLDLSHVRAIINCSEPMRLDSHTKFYERFRGIGLKYEALATCYAMAENVFAVTQGGIDAPVVVDEIDRQAFIEEKIARPVLDDGRPTMKLLSAGKPIRDTEVRILDGERQDCPERQVGEIAIRSRCMLDGYFRRPDVTQQAFHEDWYLTGDLGYLADGELYVTGRKKDLIIVGGKNIYPQDIEALVSEVAGVHPGRVVVFGIEDEELGTEQVVVLAEPEEPNSHDAAQIVRSMRDAVSTGSDVVARYVHLVEPKWLIKTSSGKIARNANRERYLREMRPELRPSYPLASDS
jgi:fatty-acyl-CoA synthase